MMGRIKARDEADGGLGPYLREIRGDELLTADEERHLALAIAGGDAGARDRMVTANLRLVIKIARDYEGHGLAIDDLIGEGNLGLIRAAEEFDPRFNVRFSTYASHWIKQTIRHALTNTTATIRLPSHMVGLIAKWRKTERLLRRSLCETPTPDQIAETLGLTATQRDLIGRAFRAQRLRQEGGEAGDAWSPDEAADPRAEGPEVSLQAADERRDLLRRMERLDERERTVVRLRFGLMGQAPLTLKEVGQRLGVTREWVRKIEIRAVRKLEDPTSSPSPSLRTKRPHRTKAPSHGRLKRSVPALQLQIA
jgi:RNA polymerase primary sigma factor